MFMVEQVGTAPTSDPILFCFIVYVLLYIIQGGQMYTQMYIKKYT